MKVSLIIEARDKASAAFGRIKNKTQDMGKGFIGAERNAGRMGLRIGLAGNKIIKSVAAADRATMKFHNRLKQTRPYQVVVRGTEMAGRGVVNLGKNIASTALRWSKWVALAGVAGIGVFAKGILSAGITFERFQVILENTEGSAQKAKAAMAWVKNFAVTTPFELDKVMESFVALKSYGIDPTNGSLTALGNAASGMGKDIMQAVEMLADAQTGEFERLKEFGVRASKQGEQVRFTYMRAGKEISKTARNNGADIQKALVGIFDERFGGMMDRQSKTFAGIWSNIKDMWQNFQLDIANAGIFDLLKQKAQGFLTKLQGWAKDGTLKKWAEEISSKLENMVNRADAFITKTDWNKVGQDLQNIASAATATANAILAIVNAGAKVKSMISDPAGFAGRVDAKVGNWLRKNNLGGADAYENFFGVTDQDRKAAGVPLRAPKVKTSPRIKQAPSKKTADVGGTLDIRIKTDKGTSARTTKLAANKNTKLNVGYARTSAA